MVAAGSVLAFELDLMFSSRIESAIGKMGVQVKVVEDYDLLLQELTKEMPKLLILDLDMLEGKLPSLRDLLSESCISVGYYSHTNTGLAETAERVGIDIAISQGAFVNRIQEIVGKVMRGQ